MGGGREGKHGGMNKYRNIKKNESWPWRKGERIKNFPRLLPGLAPKTFRSRVRCSNYWAIPVSRCLVLCAVLFVSKGRFLVNTVYHVELTNGGLTAGSTLTCIHERKPCRSSTYWKSTVTSMTQKVSICFLLNLAFACELFNGYCRY